MKKSATTRRPPRRASVIALATAAIDAALDEVNATTIEHEYTPAWNQMMAALLAEAKADRHTRRTVMTPEEETATYEQVRDQLPPALREKFLHRDEWKVLETEMQKTAAFALGLALGKRLRGQP